MRLRFYFQGKLKIRQRLGEIKIRQNSLKKIELDIAL